MTVEYTAPDSGALDRPASATPATTASSRAQTSVNPSWNHVGMDETAPVLIVGGGPAGLAASLTLSHLGVPSLLVNKHARTTCVARPRGGLRSGSVEWGRGCRRAPREPAVAHGPGRRRSEAGRYSSLCWPAPNLLEGAGGARCATWAPVRGAAPLRHVRRPAQLAASGRSISANVSSAGRHPCPETQRRAPGHARDRGRRSPRRCCSRPRLSSRAQVVRRGVAPKHEEPSRSIGRP